MKRILITGGEGDCARSFCAKYADRFEILSPGRRELDVADTTSIASYMKGLKLDVLINNAGSIHPKRILDSDEQLWIRDIEVNLIGAYRMSKAVLSSNSKALVINISSTAGMNYYPDWSSYCVSKSGLVSFTKCLAEDNYRAYSLCPGAFDTKFRDNFKLDNSNLMSCDRVSEFVVDILEERYNSGDVIMFRNDWVEINPKRQF